MGWRATLLFLATLALANAIPTRNEPRVINGEDAKLGEIPYQVSIQVKVGSHFCGGSILNENYLITAAHCVIGAPPEELKVVVGTVDLDKPQASHEVEKVIVHKKYSPNTSWKNDIALLKVKTPFKKSKYVSFVTLPNKDQVVPANSTATVSGWGATKEGGPLPKKLQRANIYIVDQDICEEAYQNTRERIFSSHICAHHPFTVQGACHGDSGGPLTVDGKIVGVVSWSYKCAVSYFPTVYTRVTSYLSWIKENAV